MKPREWVIRHVSLPEARFEARWEIEPGAYETPLRNDERLTVREVLPATECESLDAKAERIAREQAEARVRLFEGTVMRLGKERDEAIALLEHVAERIKNSHAFEVEHYRITKLLAKAKGRAE